MGGYNDNYRSDYSRKEAKERKLRKEKLNLLFQNFSKKRDESSLILVYKEFQKQIGHNFVGELLKLDNKKLEKDFPGAEYEIKMRVNADFNSDNPDQFYFLDSIREKISISKGFLPDNLEAYRRPSENFYYGRGNEDILVIMSGIEGYILKKKGVLENISLGIKNDEFIFKRSEHLKRKCSQEDVFKAIQKVTLEGAEYKGKILRNRSRIDYLSTETGRLYEVVFDICDIIKPKNKPFKKTQIEAEYLGHVPDLFKKFQQGSERQITLELLALSDILMTVAKKVETHCGRIKSVVLTKERKYDFLI
ncbi:MAG: hypothetical protein PHH54_01335 [Candidatus Nanoarchaeia archaeon]|nr:hypothetical protein [Candidatus Nanoarchaeia archaeon]MDD5740606.1 hypothetical protein [Candidatus Nanoarchaeia archaeon]